MDNSSEQRQNSGINPKNFWIFFTTAGTAPPSQRKTWDGLHLFIILNIFNALPRTVVRAEHPIPIVFAGCIAMILFNAVKTIPSSRLYLFTDIFQYKYDFLHKWHIHGCEGNLVFQPHHFRMNFGCRSPEMPGGFYFWHFGQKNVERPPSRITCTVSPQSGHSPPVFP